MVIKLKDVWVRERGTTTDVVSNAVGVYDDDHIIVIVRSHRAFHNGLLYVVGGMHEDDGRIFTAHDVPIGRWENLYEDRGTRGVPFQRRAVLWGSDELDKAAGKAARNF